MNSREYPGARWWKFDFHTHTPASNDFGGKTDKTEPAVSPELWLRKFMEKEIDCVAITDHNSGKWIDVLRQKLSVLEQERPDWYRPIYLFPGVEISANGNVHILAIFGADKTTSDIDSLLGAVGYFGTKGKSDNETGESLKKVIGKIAKVGAIPIPAHIDKEKGLFSRVEGPLLESVLKNPNIYAMELRNPEYKKPELYISNKTKWTEIVGSDVHNFENSNFGTFTWIKMDNPSIEGLKLALIDGDASVSRNMELIQTVTPSL